MSRYTCSGLRRSVKRGGGRDRSEPLLNFVQRVRIVGLAEWIMAQMRRTIRRRCSMLSSLGNNDMSQAVCQGGG